MVVPKWQQGGSVLASFVFGPLMSEMNRRKLRHRAPSSAPSLVALRLPGFVRSKGQSFDSFKN